MQKQVDMFAPPAKTEYRLWLERDLGSIIPACVFIMLNPSTADDRVDDPTLRRCQHFARRLGCGRLIVVNLFTLRSTEPEGLMAVPDPVGPGADEAICAAMVAVSKRHYPQPGAGYIIAGWGASCPTPRKAERIKFVIDTADKYRRRIYCFGRTATGEPRHPLYIRNDEPLQEWR